MPQEVAIIKKEIIIVDKVVPKTYQGATTGIIVTGKDGKTHSIGEKHKSLWNVFAPGLAVEVGYAEFRKDGVTKEYIHTARQVKDAIRPPVAVVPVNVPPVAPQAATQPKEHLVQAVKDLNRPQSTNVSIESQVAIKEILACFREGKLTLESPEVKAALKWCTDRI